MRIESTVQGYAIISPCGLYRYHLSRRWDSEKSSVCWVMLNPSTASADVDDRTIRRCLDFSRAWGYGGLSVVNLFAFRATEPSVMRATLDPIGPDNDKYLLEAVTNSARVIVAWGTHGSIRTRDRIVLNLLRQHKILVECLEKTRDGYPKHPLYCRGDLQPVPFFGGQS